MRIESIVLLMATALTIADAKSSGLTLDEEVIAFGEKYQFAEVDHDIQVWNHSAAEILLRDAELPNGVTLKANHNAIAPGQSSILHLKCSLGNRLGAVAIHVPIATEEASKREHYEIVVRGYVDSILDDVKPTLNFGVVDTRAKSVEQSIRLTSTTNPSLQVAKILEAPDFIEAHIGEDHHTVLLKPKKDGALGFHKDVVKVALDSGLQTQAWITVLMDMHGNIVPDQNPLSFGLRRPSTARPMHLQLISRDGKAFKVGKVTTDEAAHVSVNATACLPEGRVGCLAYSIAIKSDHPYGVMDGKVRFELPDSGEVLNVHLGGIYLSDNTKVRSLNEPLDANNRKQK